MSSERTLAYVIVDEVHVLRPELLEHAANIASAWETSVEEAVSSLRVALIGDHPPIRIVDGVDLNDSGPR